LKSVLFSASVILITPTLLAQTFVEIPNDITAWQRNGFSDIEGLLELPTNSAKNDHIHVWLKIPESQKLSVITLPSGRFSLVYPPGSQADRVESTDDFIDDVRGARVDENGNTLFHDYQPLDSRDKTPTPKGALPTDTLLYGYEWKRTDDNLDKLAGAQLSKLYFFPGVSWSPEVELAFQKLNHCGGCHTPNIEPNPSANPRDDYESDSRGFFQIMTALEDRIIVRDHRGWDLNADNPNVTVRCGDKVVRATTRENFRGYECNKGVSAVGELDIKKGLAAHDRHTLKLCQSRKYLFDHMDDLARNAFTKQFEDCDIH
jgi:hypothetical protein